MTEKTPTTRSLFPVKMDAVPSTIKAKVIRTIPAGADTGRLSKGHWCTLPPFEQIEGLKYVKMALLPKKGKK